MRSLGRAARRLAAGAAIALALTAAAVPGLGPGLWATRRPSSPVRLPSQKGPRHRELGLRRARCSG